MRGNLQGKNNEFHFLIASEDHEVQVYNYDGWKFHKSPVVFTGDSFGAGVVTMRGYDNIINGTTTIGKNLTSKIDSAYFCFIFFIVISNRDAFQPSINIFSPIYVTKNDSTRLKTSITKWCSDAFDRLDDFDVDETEEILKNSLELSDATNSQATFMGKLFVKNATVGVVNANEMKGRTVNFGNQTAQRVNSLTERLVTLSTAAQHVKRKVDFTRATQRKKRQTMLIRNLKVDGPLKIQSINGRPISDLVYKFNRRNTKLTGIVANEILIRENLFVNEKVDGIEMSPDNVIINQPIQNLRPFSIENLSVNNIADVARVNTLSIDRFLTIIRRKVDKKLPNMIHELKVDSLNIGQFLNDRNFTALSINSLKTSSDQIIVAPIKIGKLTANTVTFQKVLRQEISNIPLVNFIDVKERRRRIDINSDVQFTDDVKANRTIVLERIKNVNVINQKLQVLWKKGTKQQIVTAEKFFDNVTLLSPIMLQGKIESKSLEKMNPIITINDNLVLQGDYKITGPVTLRRYINVSNDIMTASGSFGLKNLAVNGLNLFTSKETSNKFVIKNVIEVKRNLEAASLNGNLVSNFVRTNVQDLQTIRGVKIFKKGLLVHGGTVQADIINEVDINQLNKTILKLSSTSTQFVTGNIEFSSLRVAQLISPAVNVNGRSSDLLLNVNRPQNLSQLVVEDAKVQNVRAMNLQQLEGGKIFGRNLNFLVDDIVTRDATADKIIAEKEFTDLNLGRLTFAEGNEWKKIILNYENAMAQDLNVTGNVDFGKEMTIGNLIVNGSINGVSYSDMTSNWLQNEGEQIFTAPQTITSLEIGNSLAVSSETINGVNIEKMKAESG